MSSDEEDYMSDAFLAKIQDVKPSLIKDNTVRRKNEIEMRKQKEKEKVSLINQFYSKSLIRCIHRPSRFVKYKRKN